MIYSTRNCSNDTIESQKEKKTCFNAHFQNSQSKIMDNKGVCSSNKMWSLKSLAKLKYESRISLHAVQYNWQLDSVLMFCSYFNKASLDTLFLCSVGQQVWLCS